MDDSDRRMVEPFPLACVYATNMLTSPHADIIKLTEKEEKTKVNTP
jgi:hypothetical protein